MTTSTLTRTIRTTLTPCPYCSEWISLERAKLSHGTLIPWHKLTTANRQALTAAWCPGSGRILQSR